MIQNIEIENGTQWPKGVKMRFIEPGPVHYENMGTVLVPMECLDKMSASLVGKPIIDRTHANAKPENFKEIAAGVISRVWKGEDGWYWCEALIWDEDCIAHCRDPQWSISCAYMPTQIDQKEGIHNGLPYSAIFMDGVYTHIAVVRDPKYSDAMIVCNSRGEKMIKLFSKTQEQKPEEKDARFVMVDGAKIPLGEVLNSYMAEQEEIKNAVADDSTIEIDGEKVPVKNMVEAYRKHKGVKNAELSRPHEEEKPRDDVDEDREEAEKKVKSSVHDKSVSARPKETFNDEKGKPQREQEKQSDETQKKLEEGHVHNSRAEFAEIMDKRPATQQASYVTQEDRLAAGRKKYGRVK